MNFVITQEHEGLTRTIHVQVSADPGKRLQRVRTTYDAFLLDDDHLNVHVSFYERTFKKSEGITPNQKHTLIVEAWHGPESHDAAQKSWVD